MVKLLQIKEPALIKVSDTGDWYAWIDKMPPPPNSFHVVGQVLVPNPGVKSILTPKVPQGINPTILLLDLILIQQSGYWPEVVTWVEARYDKIVKGSPYTSVQIFVGSDAIVEIPVDEVN